MRPCSCESASQSSLFHPPSRANFKCKKIILYRGRKRLAGVADSQTSIQISKVQATESVTSAGSGRPKPPLLGTNHKHLLLLRPRSVCRRRVRRCRGAWRGCTAWSFGWNTGRCGRPACEREGEGGIVSSRMTCSTVAVAAHKTPQVLGVGVMEDFYENDGS